MKKTRYLTTAAIVAALATVLTYFRFPLAFLPSFYKIDFSEAVIILGGYLLGPVSTVVMQALKTLLKIITSGSNSAFVGDLANFIMGLAFVLPAVWYYHRKPCFDNALKGLLIGLVTLVIVGCIVNYFIVIPMYAGMYQMPVEQIIAMYQKLNGSVTNLFTFVLFFTAPFNLIKGFLSMVIVLLIYHSTRKLFEQNH